MQGRVNTSERVQKRLEDVMESWKGLMAKWEGVVGGSCQIFKVKFSCFLGQILSIFSIENDSDKIQRLKLSLKTLLPTILLMIVSGGIPNRYNY